jgi:hypothetical protein
MSESPYLEEQIESHPEPEYISDLRILRRFVQNGSFGFKQSEDVVFQTLKARYPEAYSIFGEERRRETLERYMDSPYIELQTRTYPNNPGKDDYLKSLERLRACANRRVAYYQRAIRRRAIVRRVASRRIALPFRRDLLGYLVCVIRRIYVTEVVKAANGMISTVAIELPSH